MPRRGALLSRGFSLVEAMVSMTLLLVMCLSMLSIVPLGFHNVQTNSIQLQAVGVAQQYLDDERNALLHAIAMPTATTAPIDAGTSYVASGVTNVNHGNFAIVPDGCANVQYPGTSASVYSCSTAVSWTEAGASRSVTVQGYVTK